MASPWRKNVLSTETLTTTTLESGNNINGTYTENSSSTDDTTLDETASTVEVSFAATQSVHDESTGSGSGNNVTGDSTSTETGTQTYNFITNPTALYPYPWYYGYSLIESGTKSYTITTTASAITGDSTENETATDDCTMVDVGYQPGSGFGTETLIGEENYSRLEVSNDLNGGYSRSITDSGAYSLESGWTYSVSFAQSDSGNYLVADISSTLTGADRYSLLAQFTDPAVLPDLDFSPVGAPIIMGAPPSAPTGGGPLPYDASQPGLADALAQSFQAGSDLSGAAADAAFAEVGNDLLHQFCFARETRITLATGERIPIMIAERGQEVFARLDSNPHGPTVKRKIVTVFENKPAHLLHVCYGGETIRATDNHPWYVVGRGFVPTRDLKPGDLLLTSDDGTVAVDRIEDHDEIEPVYNLHVESAHTYFVGDRCAVLVHNESVQIKVSVAKFNEWLGRNIRKNNPNAPEVKAEDIDKWLATANQPSGIQGPMVPPEKAEQYLEALYQHNKQAAKAQGYDLTRKQFAGSLVNSYVQYEAALQIPEQLRQQMAANIAVGGKQSASLDERRKAEKVEAEQKAKQVQKFKATSEKRRADQFNALLAQGTSTAKQYLSDTGEMVILGEYSEKQTGLGIVANLAAGALGVDAPGDVRDLSHNIANWKWTWAHGGKTALNGIALLPVIGMVKYLKYAKKADDVAEGLKQSEKIGEGLDTAASVAKNGENGATAGKSAAGNVDAPSNAIEYKLKRPEGVSDADWQKKMDALNKGAAEGARKGCACPGENWSSTEAAQRTE